MSDVFISYSRRDKGFVRRLFEALKSTNRDSWVDWENIPYSAEWWKEIEAGIEAAETLIFVVSPSSLGSEICNKELAYAYKLNKRIIPIVRQEIDEKVLASVWFNQEWEFVARENWEILKKINWLFFRRKKSCYAEFDSNNIVITPERDDSACDEDTFDAAFQALIDTTECVKGLQQLQ